MASLPDQTVAKEQEQWQKGRERRGGDGTCQPGTGVIAHRHELLRTPIPGKRHPNPGTDGRVKPARGDGEKIRNRTGAMGCPDKEEKVGE